jgi:triacylglycerol lipase
MKKQLAILAMSLATMTAPAAEPAAPGQPYVILLHGLCRTGRSMIPMGQSLTQAGYKVMNIEYPSRSAGVEKLSESTIAPVIAECEKNGATSINFVTHSLGGILVRDYLSRHTIPNLGRVVMLGPPNRGSEVVDKLGSFWLFKAINGPAGSELGTGPDSIPNRLGPANFCLGVIAGDRSINWINSLLMIPGPDDGKVAVERTKLAGMTDHLVIHTMHPMMMRNTTVINQTTFFLKNGKFDRA